MGLVSCTNEQDLQHSVPDRFWNGLSLPTDVEVSWSQARPEIHNGGSSKLKPQRRREGGVSGGAYCSHKIVEQLLLILHNFAWLNLIITARQNNKFMQLTSVFSQRVCYSVPFWPSLFTKFFLSFNSWQHLNHHTPNPLAELKEQERATNSSAGRRLECRTGRMPNDEMSLVRAECRMELGGMPNRLNAEY